MAELTPEQHAELGCHACDELILAMEQDEWCYLSNCLPEDEVSKHAIALGLPQTFQRLLNPHPESVPPNEEHVWLITRHPSTGNDERRLILRLHYMPPPAQKGMLRGIQHTQLKGWGHQRDFRSFMDAVKRSMLTQAKVLSMGAPAADSEAPAEPTDYIDLDQAAALVNRSKKTLERMLEKGKMPQPDIEGGGGKKHEWIYAKLKPWLEREYGKLLPTRPPHTIRH